MEPDLYPILFGINYFGKREGKSDKDTSTTELFNGIKANRVS